tara:strand:- start:257 stop:391 length:135 start_codon:yes stop_codon:yes gene_type:complete
MKIKLISYLFLFGCVIYSGFGIYQSLDNLTSNYYSTLQQLQNEI